MRYQSKVRSAIVLFSLCLLEGICLGQTNSQPSVAPQHPPSKQTGFFDYALGKINPAGSDYGASMQAGRDAVVANTVDNLYFWSNVFTLLLLIGTSAIVFLQWRSTEKREVIAASLIAELWNRRVSDRIELERRTERYNGLVERHNAAVERALAAKSQARPAEETTATDLKRTVEGLNKGKTNPPTPAGQDAGSRPLPISIAPLRSDPRDGGSQRRNVLLEHQLEASENTIANLKQRLNQTQAQLDEERNRNQALKGA